MRIFGCIVDPCDGHRDADEAILHSLHNLADGQDTIRRDQRILFKKVGITMGIAQDILAAENSEAAAVEALGGAIVTVVGKLGDVETQLADLIANGTLSDDDKAALQSTLDTATATKSALDADLAAVNEALNPTPPVTDPGTGDTGEGDGTTDGGDAPVDGAPADGDTAPVSE